MTVHVGGRSDKRVSMKPKRNFHRMMVRPTLLYGLVLGSQEEAGIEVRSP